MNKSLALTFLLAAVLVLSACAPAATPDAAALVDTAMTIAVATIQAELTAQAGPPSLNQVFDPATTGSIAGRVPGSKFTHVAAFPIGGGDPVTYVLAAGQTDFQIDGIPAGTYNVLAYTTMGGFAGSAAAGYTQFVLCGMGNTCNDHSLLPVTVVAGQLTSGVDTLDTWQMPFYPPDPLVNVVQPPPLGGNDVIPTQTPQGGLVGGIAGTLSYPSEGIPPLAVVAFRVGGGPGDYYHVFTQLNQSAYQIDNLPPGNYTVVAYTLGGGGFPAGLAGGFTQYVLCGMQPPCSNHALAEATVTAGQVTQNINPSDWYAPQGTYPAYPIP